jgi:hypothetical protein
MQDLTTQIIRYEEGKLDPDAEVALFAELVRNGMAWRLQGHYGRVASAYIEAGMILPDGSLPPVAGVEAN